MQIIGGKGDISYFYFLYKQIVKIVPKICEPLKWLKKREEPASSKLEGPTAIQNYALCVFFKK